MSGTDNPSSIERRLRVTQYVAAAAFLLSFCQYFWLSTGRLSLRVRDLTVGTLGGQRFITIHADEQLAGLDLSAFDRSTRSCWSVNLPKDDSRRLHVSFMDLESRAFVNGFLTPAHGKLQVTSPPPDPDAETQPGRDR